jgi:hypothetical protein
LWSFGNFLPRFGMLYQEKSGNPGKEAVTVAVSSYENAVFKRDFRAYQKN